MTKHDPSILSDANEHAVASLEETKKPAAEHGHDGAAAAQPEAERKHGPTTTMKSGWASGGSAAG